MIGVEYRTLHSWLQRGLLRPSVQKSSGTGIPNLFSLEDAVKAKVIADLRQSGLSFKMLQQAATKLDTHETAVSDGAMVLVNGSVKVVGDAEAVLAIKEESLTLVYNTAHAVRHVGAAAQTA